MGTDGSPVPLPFDPTMNYPRMIFPISAVGSFNLPRGHWVEIAISSGNGSGWTFQPEGNQGQQNPSVQLLPGACFPLTKDGLLIVDTQGDGALVAIVWPPEIGSRIATARGYAPPSAASASPAKYPLIGASSLTDAPGKVTPAIGGTQLIGTILAAGGATKNCWAVIAGDGANTKGTFISRTQAGAAAFTGLPVYGAGDYWGWPVPAGGKLWAASSDGAQIIYAGEAA